jgi:hypothetical protein
VYQQHSISFVFFKFQKYSTENVSSVEEKYRGNMWENMDRFLGDYVVIRIQKYVWIWVVRKTKISATWG